MCFGIGISDKDRPSMFERGNAFQMRVSVGSAAFSIAVGAAGKEFSASYRVKFGALLAFRYIRLQP